MQRNTYSYQKIRGLKRKIHLIDLRGGGCENCGYKNNLSALEFHHQDPLLKENQLDMRKLSNSTMEWIFEEFEKCLVLCANCHKEHHNPGLNIDEVREEVKSLSEKVISITNKPNCIDCGEEINYGYKRCKPCNYKSRQKERPEDKIILEDFKTLGVTACAAKYKVARRTFNRWIKNIEASNEHLSSA
jgi:DNA-directed RNA polymerase subunit RPC12/RpoP